MDSLLQDFRFALRSLLRTPAFTVAAVLTLALGIGGTTAIFTIVDGVLLRRAPVADANRLVMVWETDRRTGTTHEPSSIPDFVDFQQRSKTLVQLEAFVPVDVSVTREGSDPRRAAALGVSAGFLQMLGVELVAGRALEDAEMLPDGPRAVLISEALWIELFEGDPAVSGKTIRLNESEWTVAGVVPTSADFGVLQILGAADYGKGFAQRGGRTRVDVWLGTRANVATAPRGNHPIIQVGRLADGATVATAQQELAAIAADLERMYPDDNTARGVNVEAMTDVVFGPVRTALVTLLIAVALVLLVACANVANLILVRSAARLREVTVRVALGAGVRRLTQQFLVEGAVLTLAGAVLGVFVAFTAVESLRALAPANLPRIDDVTIDLRVLAVTAVASIAVALAFGLLPALQARGRHVQAMLSSVGGRGGSSGREQRRLRRALVVAELAMATLLMVGAGLLVKSLWRLQQVDAGFTAGGVLKAEYRLPASRYPRDFAVFPRWTEVHQFNDRLQTRLRALPGVDAASIAAYHPMDAGSQSSIRVVGREAEAENWPEPSIRIVGASYRETMAVPLRAGRAFAESDDVAATPVVLINDAALARFFGGRDAIGQQVNLWGANRTVVGVIANEKFQGLQNVTPPAVYLPAGQVPSASGNYSILVRVPGDPAAFSGTLRSVMRDLDPQLALFGVEPLTTTVANSVGQQRFTMFVLMAFAAVALLLAAVGVHGVLSYAVAQRIPEIGVRMALGADSATVRSLVLGEGATLTAIGVAIGVFAALALSGLLSNLLFGVGPHDVVTFVTVATALGSVALVATYLPARRAARVDPLVALRSE